MLQECECNPKKLIRCDKGCEQLVAKDELPVGLPDIASWRLLKDIFVQYYTCALTNYCA